MKEKKVRVTVKKGGQQTIKKQIEQMVMLLLAISLTLVGIISCILNYTSTVSIVKESMKTTAQVAAEGVRYRLKATMNLVEIIGTVPRLSDGTVSNEEKKTLINDYLKEYNWKSTNLVGTDGISVLDDLNISDRKYFGKAVSGETAISEPVLSKETGELVITVAAPVWKDGNQGSEVVGVVVVAIDANQLSDVVRAINISKNGSAYIIDEQGNTVAHPDLELVRNSSNTIEDSAKDASLKTIAKMEQKMIAGETGVGNYRYGGTSKYMGYAPVGLNGWSLAVTAPSGDFMSGTVTSIIIIVALLIAALLIGVFLARRFGETIGGAIRKCAERLELLAQGDLSTEVPQVDSKNETKTLVDSTVRIVDTQQKVIHDLNYLLSEMADGNFCNQNPDRGGSIYRRISSASAFYP